MSDAIVRGGITLPCSSPRKARDKFAKLLCRVDPDAQQGFGFEGVFFRPGATVTDAELHPGPEYPEIPILLEYMRGPAYGIAGHQRTDGVYILWRYDGLWRELGRASSFAWEWALDLRPLALRALREARARQVEIMPDLPAIAGRIAGLLEQELRNLEAQHRQKVLGVVHDQLAARLCT